MDNATRLQYLEAMGIDVWVPRHPPVAVKAPVDDLPEFLQPLKAETVAVEKDQIAQLETPPASEPSASAHSMHLPHSAQPPGTIHGKDQAWKELQDQVAICRACGLCETRTQTVFGVGSKHASWMLIGEAPGQNEDLQGEPFVGKAGQLLTEMLRAIGLKREEVYIANILKCRPPNNRDPQAEEVAACHDFLHRQITLLNPRIILAVGRIAAQNLLKTQQPLAKLRGVRHQLDDIPLIVIPHPAYLLRSLPEKAKAWEDLQFTLSVYKELE
ncbi:MAG: uracil-DNA glycosylase [Methylomonas sp.]